MHTGGRSLAHRALTQGYWWPTMEVDAVKYTKHCMNCQQFTPNIHQPAAPLQPLKSLWPFTQWGLDIVRSLTTASGGFKFLITATDYFTKWVEAESLVTIEDLDAKRFG